MIAQMVFGGLWEELHVPQVIQRLLAGRRFGLPLERILFLTVLHRLFHSGSDRSCVLVWQQDYEIPGIGGVVTRVVEPELDKLESRFTEDFQKLFLREIREQRALLNRTIDFVREKNDHEYQSFYSGKIVDMAAKLYTSYLFLKFAPFSDHKKKMAALYFEREFPEFEKNYSTVTSGKRGVIAEFAEVLDGG